MEMNDFIKEERQRQGLTRVALAEKAGVSHLTIAQLEHGRRRGMYDCVESIVNALGYDLVARKRAD